MKKKVLIMTGFYVPSVKAGGPVQSIKNLVDNLSDRFDFYIITSDRDLGDKNPFDNLQTEKWINIGFAKVYYTDTSKFTLRKSLKVIGNIDYDILYLNSFFSVRFSIFPVILRKLRLIKKVRTVIAPRGEFSPGALTFSTFKKRTYIFISKIMNLYKNITWHATSHEEEKIIGSLFGKVNIQKVTNLTANHAKTVYTKEIKKTPGELKIAYIARIHPMKNLKQSLEILQKVKGKILFNIYGPIEDKQYWLSCEKVINSMPSNIKVKYRGIIPNNKIHEIHGNHHVYMLLTLGENFGHSISEALIGGSPVIVSNKTPWRHLSKFEAGYDLSLDNTPQIINKINYFLNLNQQEYEDISRKAFKFGKDRSNQLKKINAYIHLFNDV